MAVKKNILLAAALSTGALAKKCRPVASYEDSPFEGVALRPDPYYVDEIENLAIPQLPEELIPAAEELAKVSTFQWLDTIEAIDLLNSTLHEIRADNDAGASPPYAHTIVVYNFPDRDCSARASDGELDLEEDGLNRYKTEYIDPIAELIKEFSDIRTIIAYEPDGLANLITNMEVEKCANAAPAYREATEYALAALDFPNVGLYIDAGHAGWLGWDGNLPLTAELYAELYRNAGSPASTRGLVSNISGYNAWRAETPANYTDGSTQYDEETFHALKVFTVGLDEKEKAQKADEQKAEMTKIPIDSSSSTPAPSPPPIIIPRGPPRKVKGCGVLTWLVAAFFVVLLCLTISEITYNRQRDQAFLRLKWAELRQRMLGYELLSQATNNNLNNNNNPQPPPVVDERLAFSNRLQQNDHETESLPSRDNHEDHVENDSNEQGDARFAFLRALLDKMRQKAEDMGLTGDMQVHVIEVKPVGMDQRQQAWQDGFGEVAVPKQNFHEDYEDWENRPRQPLLPLLWDFVQTPSMPPPPPMRFPAEEPWSMGPMNRPFGPFFDDRNQDNFPPRTFVFNAPNQQQMPFPMQRPEWSAPQSFPIWNDQPQQFVQSPPAFQQNQFPFQNQAPAMPFQQQQQQQQPQQPWYLGNNFQQPQIQWTENWQQPQKPAELPVQPNPVASNEQWVDRTAGQDSPGIDGFQKEEKFNGPAIDVAVDEDPVVVPKPSFQVNAWHHTQPEPAKDVAPVDEHVGPNTDKDFLPIREDVDPSEATHAEATSGEQVDFPLPPHHDDADMEKKLTNPFFQIDDPNSFRR